jgi:DNA-binding NtrC family response regulator
MVAAGSFREDLLYRLRVIALELPPLRERREDIPVLATHFVAELAARHGRPVRGLTEAARLALLAHDWPGNARELRNALERAVVLAQGEDIDAGDLPASIARGRAALRPDEAALAELPFAAARARALEAFDPAFLAAALERHGGNVSATARALGLHRQSPQKLLRKAGIGEQQQG